MAGKGSQKKERHLPCSKKGGTCGGVELIGEGNSRARTWRISKTVFKFTIPREPYNVPTLVTKFNNQTCRSEFEFTY